MSSGSTSGTDSPQAPASRRHVASLAAIGCGPSGLSIQVEGASWVMSGPEANYSGLFGLSVPETGGERRGTRDRSR